MLYLGDYNISSYWHWKVSVTGNTKLMCHHITKPLQSTTSKGLPVRRTLFSDWYEHSENKLSMGFQLNIGTIYKTKYDIKFLWNTFGPIIKIINHLYLAFCLFPPSIVCEQWGFVNYEMVVISSKILTSKEKGLCVITCITLNCLKFVQMFMAFETFLL